jgi:hypothetical protein
MFLKNTKILKIRQNPQKSLKTLKILKNPNFQELPEWPNPANFSTTPEKIRKFH